MRAAPAGLRQYLDDRKAQIYENLRDLQFEYRVGKLSDEDYQSTKRDLIYSAVMEGQRALPGEEMTARLQGAFQQAGV